MTTGDCALSRDPGSFQDPAGTVFQHEGRIFRSVSDLARSEYEQLRDASFYEELVGDGMLVSQEEVDFGSITGLPADTAYLLEHGRIPFVSYPYEWSFSQLKAAALFHLDLQLFALERNVALKDASAYNIQFVGHRPKFIDCLSFRPYRDGEYWYAHSQFCEHFLCPLLLRSKLGIAHNAWYRGNLNGIGISDLNRALPLSKKMSWRVFTHIVLQSRLQDSSSKMESEKITGITERKLPKRSYEAMLRQLRNWIDGLKPAGQKETTWESYVNTHTYDEAEWDSKVGFVAKFAAAVKPDVIWDLGCNTGHFCEVALEAGAGYAVGFDFDQGALETGYQRSAAKQLSFLPLFLDASNPSADQGWNGEERKSLMTRHNADAVVSLAFVHHLAVAKNIPLGQAIAWITGAAKYGVIEFVPENDPTVLKMTMLRKDRFHPYNEQIFEAELSKLARIEKTMEVTDTGRTLYWYDRSAA